MSSVRVISPDWTGAIDRLQSWADHLVVSGNDVLGVLLYGSLARDDHAPGSDADVIVVLESSEVPPAERAEQFPPPRIGLPTDITVYTEKELSRMVAEGLPFLTRALNEGRWLVTAHGWEHP